ncbi:MAG: hypothetical protein WD689_10085 [Gaiellaceae bacterium]
MSGRVSGLALIAALALSGVVRSAVATPTPTVAPSICTRFSAAFWIEFGVWGGPGTPHRLREHFALVGSRGASRPGGYVIYGSATPTRVARDASCRPTRLAANPDDRKLSQPYSYRPAGDNVYFTRGRDRLLGTQLHIRSFDAVVQHDAVGVTFICAVPGEVTVFMTEVADGQYFSARIGRELFGTAVLRTGRPSTLRISKRCEQR